MTADEETASGKLAAGALGDNDVASGDGPDDAPLFWLDPPREDAGDITCEELERWLDKVLGPVAAEAAEPPEMRGSYLRTRPGRRR